MVNLLIPVLLIAVSCYAQDESVLKLTTREISVAATVLDESGRPLPNFPCTIGFHWPSESGAAYKYVPNKGTTNAQGVFSVEGRTQALGIGSRAEGYYVSRREVSLGKSDEQRWLPYRRSETLVVKKIINPVPMYAMANLKLTFPTKEGEFGYDLVQRDWVAPHGKGRTADLVFVQQKNESPFGSKASLRLRFARPSDGLIPVFELKGGESELRLPRQAPEEGYQAERVLTREWVSGRPMADLANPSEGYLLRVRTELAADGKVKKAWYGKIDGEFKWEARYAPTGTVEFTYYVNPDGTRNLEFDRKRNLFGKLPHGHEVERP